MKEKILFVGEDLIKEIVYLALGKSQQSFWLRVSNEPGCIIRHYLPPVKLHFMLIVSP